MSEEWRAIPDFPKHEASACGQIRRRGARSPHRQFERPNGYIAVSISGRKYFVHRLVCAAFHGAPSDGLQASHENGDRSDNRASNLCWRTPSENNRLKRQHGTHIEGSACHTAKVTEAAVIAIRAAHRLGIGTHKTIADVFGIKRATVGDIINRRTWRHVE